MSEVSDHYRTVADAFTARVEGVRTDQWDAQTPCAEWDTRQLLEHVVSVHRMAIAGLAGEPAAEPIPGEDLVTAWSACTGQVADALSDPERAATPVTAGPFGVQPFEQLIDTLVCADTLVHTWDLARATGQDERLDTAAVNRSMALLSTFDAGMRSPGGFADKIDPPSGADDQTRLLNFCGRAC